MYIHDGVLTGDIDWKHQTRIIRSKLPAANKVLSKFTAMSIISADAPRKVASKRPSMELQTLTSKSSAPVMMYVPVRSNSTQYTADKWPNVCRYNFILL